MAADEEWGSVVYDADSGESEDIVQVLSRARLFDTLTGYELWKLAPIIHHRFYLPREVIVRQGAPGAGLFIILDGSADVVLQDSNGEDIVLAALGEGQMFGEISLVDGAPRAASVISTTRSHILGFFKADLMELVEHSPTLGFKILYRLTQLLNEKFSESLTEFRDQEKLIRLSKRATGQSG
ncbi:MAG: cAMP-binding protein [Gemmatimonadetes bacterium]|nr:cAMP-binding protein [Gemmatimonadota bacterium]